MVLDTQRALTYDVDTGRRLGAPLVANNLAGVVFANATTLAIPVAEHNQVHNQVRNQVRLWHLDLARLKTEACRAAGRNLTHDEWARLGPTGQPYRLTCPQFGEPPNDPTLSVEQSPATGKVPTT